MQAPLQGAGGIGGLPARSQDFTSCGTNLTYRLTNDSGFCITNLTLWDNSQTHAAADTWEFSPPRQTIPLSQPSSPKCLAAQCCGACITVLSP